MSYVIGIDLGTTYTAAALESDGHVEVFQLGSRGSVIPSIVVLRADGEILTGEAAERRALSEPTRTAREFKRRLGDPVPLILGGTPYGAESIISLLLRAVIRQVSEQRGEPPTAICLTHPASYGPYKLDLLRQAVRQADVRDPIFLSEPEAAALHYAAQERVDPGTVIAVYDFGGGTFDAAVLRKTDSGFELLGDPEGMERLGGIDFDEAIFQHVAQALGGKVEELDPADSSAQTGVTRLREECQRAKEALSADTEAVVQVLLPNVQTEIRITRSEFEAIITPRVRETAEVLQRTVRSAQLSMDDVDRILLVGGTSRIPLIGALVREMTGRQVAVDAHPKHAIALGAASEARRRMATGATQQPAAPPVPHPVATSPPAPVDTPPVAAAAPPASLAAAAPPQPADPPQSADPPPPAPVTAAPAAGGGGQPPARNRRLYALGAAAAFVVAVAAGIGLFLLLGDDGGTAANPGETETPATETVAAETPSPGATPPTATPTATRTPSPTLSPTPTLAPNTSRISAIRVAGNTYEVTFETAGFAPALPGQHVHFFFDTVPPERAGVPESGPWFVYGGGSPFTGYGLSDRPANASQICILVANPDHSVNQGTGNCADLPD